MNVLFPQNRSQIVKCKNCGILNVFEFFLLKLIGIFIWWVTVQNTGFNGPPLLRKVFLSNMLGEEII